MLNRRALLALGGTGLLLPRRLFGVTASSERNFVFVFNPGGWDPSFVFCPVFGDGIDRMAGDEVASTNGITYVTSESRPSVAGFFDTWGDRACVINGIEVPSVAHDVCTRWVMTGNSLGSTDDWASLVAGNSSRDLVMPNVHVSGPMFPLRYASASVRLGSNGQLAALLGGDALARSDAPIDLPSGDREALEDTIAAARLERFAARHPSGMGAAIAEAEALALERSRSLVEYLDALSPEADTELLGAMSIASRVIGAGLSRSAIVGYGVGGNGDWDTHGLNDSQSGMYEELFSALDTLCADLDGQAGRGGGTLLDETVIVVLSEMGRTPTRNASGGKDHWTWTSAMLIGGGVRGGQAIGEWNEGMSGEAVDLATGEVGTGTTLRPYHVGATLLALAGLDPAEFLEPEQAVVIDAAMA